jgi:hypothetical protein
VQHFPNLSLTYLSSSIMNIANLNDADLQALDKLNHHRFQAMDPLLCDGAQADEAAPEGNLGANLPDHDGALDDVAAALLAPPGGPPPPGGGNPHGMALKLEPYELAYYLAKEYEETSLAEETTVMGQHDNLGADADGATLMVTASSSPATKYFLVNLDGMVSVHYGMAKCFKLIQTGCYYALKGDYSRVHPDAPASPPDLQVLPGGSRDQDQAWTFEAVEIRVPFLVDAIQELRAHPEQRLVAPLDEAGGAPTTAVW